MSKAIYVKTSDTCNLHCDHCFTNGRNGGKVRWDVEATIAWIDDFIAHYPDDESITLILHGGEPLLAPIDDLEHFVAYYERRPNVGITITTNLVLKLDDRKLALLRRIGFVGTSWDVGVRFETPTQKALWEKNVELLRKEGIPRCVFVSVNTELVNMDILDFLNEMHEVGPENIKLERLTLDGNALRNPAIFPDNEVQDNWFVEVYRHYSDPQFHWNFSIGTLDIIEEKLNTQIVKTDTNCRNCEQNLVTMNADGTLAGCPNTAASRKHATINDDVDTFLTSDGRLAEITHELDFHPNCLQCDVFHLCGGDCHQLPWQGDRCGGLKNLLRYIKYGETNQIPITFIDG